MGLLFGKVNIDDKDLKIIEIIVNKLCQSIDNVAKSMSEIAKAIAGKKIKMD